MLRENINETHNQYFYYARCHRRLKSTTTIIITISYYINRPDFRVPEVLHNSCNVAQGMRVYISDRTSEKRE